MTPISHGFSGGLIAFPLQAVFRKYITKPQAAWLLCATATFPDVDYFTRLLGTKYYYNEVGNFFLSHRGITHSAGGVLAVALFIALVSLLYMLIPPNRGWKHSLAAFLVIFLLGTIGGSLHILEDYLGPNGPWGGLVPFYPFSEMKVKCLAYSGWYDFIDIYLFTAGFLGLVLVNLLIFVINLVFTRRPPADAAPIEPMAGRTAAAEEGLPRIRPLWDGLVNWALFAAVLAIYLVHLHNMPPYPDAMRFKKAEAIWKEYQATVLPPQISAWNAHMQEEGMRLLFTKQEPIPQLKLYEMVTKVVGYVLAIFLTKFLIAGAIHVIRKRSVPWGPIKSILFTYFLILGVPYLGYLYTSSKEMFVTPPADQIPLSSGFDFPAGNVEGMGWNGVNERGWYKANLFLAPYYHPGEDWNGAGGGDSDFGQPISAVSEGRVVFSGNLLKLGNVVIVAHRLPPTDEIVYSVYMHLHERTVEAGIVVARRARVGTVGKGMLDAMYPAHLHFEIRRANMAAYKAGAWPLLTVYLSTWGAPVTEQMVKNWIVEHYYNPSKFIRSHRLLRNRPPTLASR